MTDLEMTDLENFLSRWSRRKLGGADAQSPAPERAAGEASRELSEPRDEPAGERKHAPESASKTEFDIASLPPLESITSATDVRAFLAPGVPQELARAALRRAWSADPAIRDFVGLQEYDWDFTDPQGIPGFGELPAGTDIKKLVAQVFGETEVAEPRGDRGSMSPDRREAQPLKVGSLSPGSANESSEPEDRVADTAETSLAKPAQRGDDGAHDDQSNIVRRKGIVAMQQGHSADSGERPSVPRSHGRALPK